MSEITRKALEAMGFEYDAEYDSFSFGVDSIYRTVSVAECEGLIDVRLYGVSPLFDELSHIRTIPQLRQLIRSLFGDDALPRRELSSITDEELKNLFNIVSGDDYRPDEIIESKRMESCWNVGILDYIIVSLSDLGLVSHFPNNFYHDEVTPEAYNYLVNELDFHLPAFHDDKGGEQ